MADTVTKDDVLHIARLGRLEYNDEEAEKFKGELNAILGYVTKLNELDTDNVEPTSHVLDLNSVMRADEVKPSLGAEKILKNAPEQDHDHFRVPRVVE